MKILLIDSQGSFTSGLRRHFEQQGHEVATTKVFDAELAAGTALIWQEWLDVEAINLTNAKRRWGARTVARAHRYEIDGPFLERINFDRLDDVIFVSPTWHRKAQEKYPNLRQTRTHVIPNGVDLDKFSWKEHGPGNVVGIVGIMRPLSQPQLIIDIAKRYPDMIFRWAGAWANWCDKRYVKQWHAEAPSNIECLGWIPHDEMVAFYDGLNFYLNSKETEAFGFGICEAMARGVKPLIYDGTGIRDHWPSDLIWRTMEELDELLKGPYESQCYRDYVERYSLDKMLKSIDELIEVKRPLVSATIIAKNEEGGLERAVQSVRPYVDEVVIGIDEKSEDKTLEIAKRVADVTYKFEFENFAQARNLVIEHSSGDWWMLIDGHEVFRNANDWHKVKDENGNEIEVFEPKDDFRGWIRSCPSPAIDCQIYMDRDQYGVPSLQFLFPRVLRHWARWVGDRKVHNLPNIGGGLARRDWQFYHERGQQSREAKKGRDEQRKSMNVWELRQNIKANPKDARAYFYLGNTYRELAEWSMALLCYQQCLLYDKWPEERSWARAYSAQCLLQLGEKLRAKEMILGCLHEEPIRAEPFVMLGDLAYGEGRNHEAAFFYRIAVSIPLPVNARLFVSTALYTNGGRMGLDKLSLALHKLGDHEGAIQAAEKVYEVRKEQRILNNIRFYKEALEKQQKKTEGG